MNSCITKKNADISGKKNVEKIEHKKCFELSFNASDNIRPNPYDNDLLETAKERTRKLFQESMSSEHEKRTD